MHPVERAPVQVHYSRDIEQIIANAVYDGIGGSDES